MRVAPSGNHSAPYPAYPTLHRQHTYTAHLNTVDRMVIGLCRPVRQVHTAKAKVLRRRVLR